MRLSRLMPDEAPVCSYVFFGNPIRSDHDVRPSLTRHAGSEPEGGDKSAD
jgi:hypothetical protein